MYGFYILKEVLGFFPEFSDFSDFFRIFFGFFEFFLGERGFYK